MDAVCVCVTVCTRCAWNRIIAVQLFIQHVCPPGTKDQLTVKNLMPLWTVSMTFSHRVDSLQMYDITNSFINIKSMPDSVNIIYVSRILYKL